MILNSTNRTLFTLNCFENFEMYQSLLFALLIETEDREWLYLSEILCYDIRTAAQWKK